MSDTTPETSTNTFSHVSVLLKESVDALAIKPDGIYVDCTLAAAATAEVLSAWVLTAVSTRLTATLRRLKRPNRLKIPVSVLSMARFLARLPIWKSVA